jgi:hypothetical protein
MLKLSPAAIARERAKRASYVAAPILLDPKFPAQNALILDTSRYISVQCSRRAGKTNGLAIRFFRTLEKYPNSQSVYLSLTLDSAREIMWPVLMDLNEKFKLGCTFVESKLTMTHPNGAKLKLFGADMKNFIKRLKGRKHPGIAIDEAQDFGTHLQSLIDDVLNPCIADYSDGWIALTGTPGPVPKGYFFDITQNRKFGYSFHEWTILDNPYMPDPVKFIEDLKTKREWLESNPTLQREWRNKWILDAGSLWVRYKESNNHYTTLPDITPHKYKYILGIDIGFNDADALAVLAWSEHSPVTYLVEEVITARQGITELTDQIKALEIKYDISKMVIDAGGLGKKIAEELRKQKHIPVYDADKRLKQQNVEFLNDAMRMSNFMAKSASRFAQDSYLIQIDWDRTTPDRIVIKKNPHSDIIDAVLYAFRESPAYTFTKPVEPPRYGSKEWAEAQEDTMFNAEMDGMQQEAETTRRLMGDDN